MTTGAPTAEGTPGVIEAVHAKGFNENKVGVDNPIQAKRLEGYAAALDEGRGRDPFAGMVAEKHAELTPDEGKRMAGEFGGGTKPPTPEGQRIQDEAMETMKSLSEWQQFSNLLDKAAREGKDPKTDPELKTQYDALRKSGLEALLKGSNIMAVGPELAKLIEGGDNTKLLEVIEVRLANDPKIRALITEKLITAKGKINFSEITDDPEIRAAEAKLGNAGVEGTLDTRQNKVLEEIRTTLKDKAALGPKEEAEMLALIKAGETTEVVLSGLRSNLLTDANFPGGKAADFISMPGIQTEVDRLRAEWQKIISNPGAEADAKSLYEAELAKLNVLKKKYKVDESSPDPDYLRYKELNAALSPQKDTAGNYQTILAQRVAEIGKINTQRKEAEDLLFAKQQTLEASREKDIKVRLGEEEAALAELQKVLPSAVSEVLTERLLKIQEVDAANRRIEGDANTQKAIKEFRRLKNAHYIGVENGKYVVDKTRRDNIIGHIDKVATKLMSDEDPEETFKEIAFDISKSMWVTFTETTDSSGITKRTRISPQNYSQLNPEQKKQFDEMYRQEGQAMKDKLFTDFYAQRELQRWDQKKITGLKEALPNWMGGSDRMGLTEQQFAALGGKMKEQLVAGLENSKAKNPTEMIKELEREGLIPANADKKKLIPWIFAILGASIALGATGGLVTVVPAGFGVAGSLVKGAAVGFGSAGSAAVVGGAPSIH